MTGHRGPQRIADCKPTGHASTTIPAVLALQRTAGNRATSTWLAIQRSSEPEGAFGERPNLDVKDTGPGVRLLQRRLAEYGHPVQVTGVFDTATHDAVLKFQSERPTLNPATGGVGPLTWAALDVRFAPAPSQIGNFGSRPNIEKGNSGPGVRLLKQRLVHFGHALRLTETFNQETHDAVVAFQKRHPELLPATGGVGPLTWAALDAPFAGICPHITSVRLLGVSPIEVSPRDKTPGFGLISTHELTLEPAGVNPFDILTREVVSEGAPPNPPFANVAATNGPQGDNVGRLVFSDIHFIKRAALIDIGKLTPGKWLRHQEYQYKSAPAATNPCQADWKVCATYDLVREVVKDADGQWHFRTSVTGEEPVDQIIKD